MKIPPIFALRIVFTLAFFNFSALAQYLQFAQFGDFKLENGQIIRDCRIAYRTFGKLNAAKSNAIIFPTWAGGTTEQLKGTIVPGKIDSNRYFVIAIDALANGV